MGNFVKTLYPCSSHQNSWDLWMFIPLKMVLIGIIDPYPYGKFWEIPAKNMSFVAGEIIHQMTRGWL